MYIWMYIFAVKLNKLLLLEATNLNAMKGTIFNKEHLDVAALTFSKLAYCVVLTCYLGYA